MEEDFFRADGGIEGVASVETPLEIFLGLDNFGGANGYTAVTVTAADDGGSDCCAVDGEVDGIPLGIESSQQSATKVEDVYLRFVTQ